MCQVDNYVYVFGGQSDKSKVLNTVERLHIGEGQISQSSIGSKWEQCGPMLKAAANVGILVLNTGRILVLGGTTQTETLTDAYYYDIDKAVNQQEI